MSVNATFHADYIRTMRPVQPRVEKLWPGETVVCLGAGPSLTPEDVDYCRGRARVIAIKDAIRLAPWADLFYCSGGEIVHTWWKHYGAGLMFEGPRYTLDPKAAAYATVLRQTGITGLELDPTGLRTGKNSGYQAVNLCAHLGAAKIVLLGYDMQPDAGRLRWFGAHPYPSAQPPFAEFLKCWPTIVEPLQALGIEVLNASRQTALECFPRVTIEEALA